MWEKLSNIAQANKAEWNRTVAENSELIPDLRTLRKRYGLPIEHSEFYNWYRFDYPDSEQSKKLEKFHQDVDDLAAKHKINMDKWSSPFIYLIVLGEPGPISLGGGFPKIQVQQDSEGRITNEVLIDLETAVDNPIIQKYIADIHKQNILAKDPPPLPKKQVGSRKVDWQPVWEWSKRYPVFSLKEIASQLGYSYGTVRNRLSGLDSEGS